VVPVRLDSDQLHSAADMDPGAEIRNGRTNKAVGRLLAFKGGHGLAMIRLQEGFSAESLVCLDRPVVISKPVWWPPEKRSGMQGSKAEE
jgi:hypothetical protein